MIRASLPAPRPKFSLLRRIGAAAVALALPGSVLAAPASPVGIWNGGTVDSVAHLYVLDDNHYCFTLMAGNLDLLSAGRWEKRGDKYRFTETKAESPLFPMAKRTGHAKPGQRTVTLNGRMFSDADTPAIGFLKNLKDPLSLRRIFSPDTHGWSDLIAIPAAAMEGARYIVIGDRADANLPENAFDPFAPPYRLYIYELGTDAAEYRIGYNRRQAMPRIDFTADVGPDIMVADAMGRMTRSQTKLSEEMIANIRRDCIGDGQKWQERARESRGITTIIPVETRDVQSLVINDDPLLSDSDTAEDGLVPALPNDPAVLIDPPPPLPLDTTSLPPPPAPPPPRAIPTKAAKSSSGEDLESRFDRALRIKNTSKRAAAYNALWKPYINSQNDDQREVAARAAINLSNDLNSQRKYHDAIRVSTNAFSALMNSPSPVLRSRAASLLNNQATAWEGLKRPDQQEEMWRRIVDGFAEDSYPTTIYIRASNLLNMVDRMILRGRKAEAVALLDAFDRDYVASGKLAERPEDAFGINCDADGPQIESAVPCMGSLRPDVAYFKKYAAAYREKIATMKDETPGASKPAGN